MRKGKKRNKYNQNTYWYHGKTIQHLQIKYLNSLKPVHATNHRHWWIHIPFASAKCVKHKCNADSAFSVQQFSFTQERKIIKNTPNSYLFSYSYSSICENVVYTTINFQLTKLLFSNLRSVKSLMMAAELNIQAKWDRYAKSTSKWG